MLSLLRWCYCCCHVVISDSKNFVPCILTFETMIWMNFSWRPESSRLKYGDEASCRLNSQWHGSLLFHGSLWKTDWDFLIQIWKIAKQIYFVLSATELILQYYCEIFCAQWTHRSAHLIGLRNMHKFSTRNEIESIFIIHHHLFKLFHVNLAFVGAAAFRYYQVAKRRKKNVCHRATSVSHTVEKYAEKFIRQSGVWTTSWRVESENLAESLPSANFVADFRKMGHPKIILSVVESPYARVWWKSFLVNTPHKYSASNLIPAEFPFRLKRSG